MSIQNLFKDVSYFAKFTEFKLWAEIQNVIGNAKQWPKWIRSIFWTANTDHKHRPLLVAFAIFNGMPPSMLLAWIDKKKLARDNAAFREFHGYIKAFKNEPEKWKDVYTFCLHNEEWYYLDGCKRIPFTSRINSETRLNGISLSVLLLRFFLFRRILFTGTLLFFCLLDVIRTFQEESFEIL